MAMSGPVWLADFFATVMLLVALASAIVLLRSWRTRARMHADIDLSHLVMGAAMAGMLAPALRFGSNPVWEFVYAIGCLWFGRRSYQHVVARSRHTPHTGDQSPHHAHYVVHLVMVAAMLYMYALPSGSGGSMSMPGAGMSGAGPHPAGYLTFSLLFLLVLVVAAVREVDTFGARSRPEAEGSTLTLTRALPIARVADACHVAMCITMGYLLVVML